jgi:peptide/nickel transport system substrate-binding protein
MIGRPGRRRLGSSLALGVALLAASCGGGHKHRAAAIPASTVVGREFPVLRLETDTAIDYVDPGLTYTPEGWSVLWDVYLPLLGYRHVSGPAGATIVPYLAQGLPHISPDGKTYSLVLRPGLRYSNGKPVKASDFKAAIERDYRVDSPGVALLSNIVGAVDYERSKARAISGITADDATGRITIHLKTPQADFENVLASEFAAPVPAGAPAADTSVHPLPATGPYVIETYKPNSRIVEVRNRYFDPAIFGGNVPSGNPDSIVWDVVSDDAVALRRVIDGQDDWDGYHAIPPDQLREVERKYPAQIRKDLEPNTYYFFMNTRLRPFTSLAVRRAVNYAIDREKLVEIYGGLAVPTENILPPTDPQYRRHAFYPHDLARAKRLVAQSGFKGMRVTVWSHQFVPDSKATAYLVDVLNSIGFKAKEKVVPASAYWGTIGDKAARAQIGFADWFQDYPHPLDWFDVLLNGRRISKSFNNNYANFDDPAANATIGALERQPVLTPEANAEWARLDATVMQEAPWAPFLNRQFTDVFSRRVDPGCYVNHVVYGFDYALACTR